MRRRALVVGLGVFLAAPTVWAAPPRTALDTRPDVVVEASLGDIDVVVRTTTAARVEVVEASLPPGFAVVLEGSARRAEVDIEGLGVPSSGRLELSVPKKARLHLDTRNGDVTMHGLEGEADVRVVRGDILVDGAPDRVTATTTSGDVSVDGVRKEAELATVSGDVTVAGARGRLEVSAVSGGVQVTGSTLDRSSVSVVSGAISFDAAFRGGAHELAAHSGDITVVLDPKESVRVRVETFSGTIEDALVDPPVTARGRHQRQLGQGTARLDVGTFSGDVRLSPRRAD